MMEPEEEPSIYIGYVSDYELRRTMVRKLSRRSTIYAGMTTEEIRHVICYHSRHASVPGIDKYVTIERVDKILWKLYMRWIIYYDFDTNSRVPIYKIFDQHIPQQI